MVAEGTPLSAYVLGLSKGPSAAGSGALSIMKVWRRPVGDDSSVVIERVDFDEDADAVVVSVRSRRQQRMACGRCGRLSARYDRGEGRR